MSNQPPRPDPMYEVDAPKFYDFHGYGLNESDRAADEWFDQRAEMLAHIGDDDAVITQTPEFFTTESVIPSVYDGVVSPQQQQPSQEPQPDPPALNTSNKENQPAQQQQPVIPSAISQHSPQQQQPTPTQQRTTSPSYLLPGLVPVKSPDSVRPPRMPLVEMMSTMKLVSPVKDGRGDQKQKTFSSSDAVATAAEEQVQPHQSPKAPAATASEQIEILEDVHLPVVDDTQQQQLQQQQLQQQQPEEAYVLTPPPQPPVIKPETVTHTDKTKQPTTTLAEMSADADTINTQQQPQQQHIPADVGVEMATDQQKADNVTSPTATPQPETAVVMEQRQIATMERAVAIENLKVEPQDDMDKQEQQQQTKEQQQQQQAAVPPAETKTQTLPKQPPATTTAVPVGLSANERRSRADTRKQTPTSLPQATRTGNAAPAMAELKRIVEGNKQRLHEQQQQHATKPISGAPSKPPMMGIRHRSSSADRKRIAAPVRPVAAIPPSTKSSHSARPPMAPSNKAAGEKDQMRTRRSGAPTLTTDMRIKRRSASLNRAAAAAVPKPQQEQPKETGETGVQHQAPSMPVDFAKMLRSGGDSVPTVKGPLKATVSMPFHFHATTRKSTAPPPPASAALQPPIAQQRGRSMDRPNAPARRMPSPATAGVHRPTKTGTHTAQTPVLTTAGRMSQARAVSQSTPNENQPPQHHGTVVGGGSSERKSSVSSSHRSQSRERGGGNAASWRGRHTVPQPFSFANRPAKSASATTGNVQIKKEHAHHPASPSHPSFHPTVPRPFNFATDRVLAEHKRKHEQQQQQSQK